MKLELRVIRPERLSVSDCDVISLMHMQSGPEKNQRYDDLMENTYQVDDDELDLFKDHRDAIYHFSGYNLKASLITTLEIDCSDELYFDENGYSFIIMRPICQRFADQYYSCEKFYWTACEFRVFLYHIIQKMTENNIDDDAVKDIQTNIISILEEGKTFVCFCFK